MTVATPWRRLVKTGQITLSAVLVIWLASRLDATMLQALAAVPPITFVAAVVVFASAQVWGAVRLWLLLGIPRPRLRYILRLTFVGYFFSNFLPGTIGGDITKGTALARDGRAVGSVVTVLLVDRLINVLAAVALAVMIVPASPLRGMLLAPNSTVVTVLATLAAVLVSLLLVGLWPSNRRRMVMARITGLGGSLLSGIAPPGRLGAAFLLSIASLGASILAQWELCAPLGIEIDLLNLTAIVCTVYLITMVPISFNGIGLQEASLVSLLGLCGSAEPAALTFALLSRLLILVTSLGGGALLLLHSRTKRDGINIR